VSAERLRGTFSCAPTAAAVLQQRVPEGGAKMGAVEGAAEIPGDEGWPAETQWPKPVLPGAGQKPETI
jgi:hypothetical protein